MPCRTRAAGLEVEGWGNVFIEAAACGRPVVVGDSGGAPEALDRRRDRVCASTGDVWTPSPTRSRPCWPTRSRAEDGRGRACARRPLAYVAGDRRPAGRMAPRRGGLRVVRRVSFEGYPSAVPDEERRCPNCGALVSEDAAWCGQCFTPLRRAPDPPAAPRPEEPEKVTAVDVRPPNRRNGRCRSGRARCVAGRTRSSWIRVRRAARRSRR